MHAATRTIVLVVHVGCPVHGRDPQQVPLELEEVHARQLLGRVCADREQLAGLNP